MDREFVGTIGAKLDSGEECGWCCCCCCCCGGAGRVWVDLTGNEVDGGGMELNAGGGGEKAEEGDGEENASALKAEGGMDRAPRIAAALEDEVGAMPRRMLLPFVIPLAGD